MSAIVVNYAHDREAGGKFVVLAPLGSGDGLVLFSNFFLHSQHAYIVSYWEMKTRTSVREAGLRIDGGGWWKYIAGNRLKLYGSSAAFGEFDPDWLRENLRPGTVFAEQSFIIE